MADLADAMDLLERLSEAAVYPNGTGTASITGMPVYIAQGWPPAKDLDKEIEQGNSMVSIYAEPSSTSPGDTPLGSTYVVTPPAHGTVVAVADPVVTFSGVPVVGDIVVLLLDAIAYPYTVQAGDTLAAVISACKTLILGRFPDASVLGTSLTVASAYSVSALVSGPGVFARKVHRQRTQFQVVVWAPNPADRSTLARALDLAFKVQVRQPLSDSTCALLSYQGTNLRDKDEKEGVFRRDVLLNVVYETIELVAAQEVVATQYQES